MTLTATRWIAHHLAVLSLVIPLTHTWIISSRHNTQLAFHSAFDSRKALVLTTGVLFRTALKDYTLSGPSDTDCFISLGFDRALYESPQLCTHFEMFPVSTSGGLPAGVSLGIDGNQASISSILQLTEYNQDWRFADVHLLPVGQFPIAVATDASGSAYIGMHETNGELPPAAKPSQPEQELLNLYKYHRRMTHPWETTHVESPIIVKVNILTGKQEWRLNLTTTYGRSNIGGVVHLPSRNLVVVAGSSNGEGSLVGGGEWSNSWDGYLTLINATTGKMDEETTSTTSFLSEHSERIQSQVGADDFIHGLCAVDDNLLIVVGSTTGKMTSDTTAMNGGAFVRVYDVDTLKVKWTYQWPGGMHVEALKCAATSRYVYVAGHVPAGVSLEKKGGTRDSIPSTQDLFVSLLDTSDGNLRWTRQIDSRRNDTLANIFVSPTGDLVMAHNAMDFELGFNEVLTSTVSNSDGFYDWKDLPSDMDPLGGQMPTVSSMQPDASSSQISKEKKSREGSQSTSTAAKVISTVLAFAACILLLMVVIRRVRRRNVMFDLEGPESKEHDQPPIIEDEDFDSNDLELRDVVQPEPVAAEPSDDWIIKGEGGGVV